MVRLVLFLVSIAGAVPPRRDVELRSLLADVDALSVLERRHTYWAEECCAPLDDGDGADCNELAQTDPRMYYPPADGSCDTDAVEVVRRAWSMRRLSRTTCRSGGHSPHCSGRRYSSPIAPGFLAHVGITFKSFTQADF